MRMVLHVLRIAIPSSLVANPVFAHAFGRPYDLPIPLSLYLAGAGVVVALSFVIAVFAFRVVVPTLDATERLRLMPWVSAWQAISVAVFLLVIAAGLLGAQRTFKNIAPLAVWVIGWAGLSLVCGFIGDVWVILNPWAAVHTWAERLARSIRLPLSLNLPLPTWVGSWPALGLFFGFAWCELLWDGSGHPHDIADLLIRYSVLTWIGMVLFGRTVWLRTGEALSVAFGLFGCFAPVSLRCVDGGRIGIGLRPFGIGLLRDLPYTVSRTAFLILMLATVTFDGLSETPVWLALLRLFQSIGGNAITIATAGLVLLPVIFGGAFVATVWFCRRLAQDRQPLIMLACTFAPTLLPIALAYQLAHNLSFLLLGLQYHGAAAIRSVWPWLGSLRHATLSGRPVSRERQAAMDGGDHRHRARPRCRCVLIACGGAACFHLPRLIQQSSPDARIDGHLYHDKPLDIGAAHYERPCRWLSLETAEPGEGVGCPDNTMTRSRRSVRQIRSDMTI